MFTYTVTETTLNIAVDKKLYVVNLRELNPILKKELRHALATGDRNVILRVVDKAQGLNLYTKGKCSVKGGRLYLGDTIMHGYLADKIIAMHEEGHPVEAFFKFFEKLMKNPSERVRERLYRFMEYGNIPINQDGDILAYKYVRNDYMDAYSGKFLNKPGCTLRMPRHEVCDDPEQGCSSGLNVSPAVA